MDQVVQQNASLVEEATAATESMKQQALTLLNSVSQFDIGRKTGRPVQVARPAPAHHDIPASIQPIKSRTSAPKEIGAPELPPADSATWAKPGRWREF